MPRKKKAAAREKVQGRPSPRSPSPPQSEPADSSHDDDPPEESSAGESSSRDASPASLPKAKKAKKTTHLTLAEEEAMAEWIQENECLYNKKRDSYKDKPRKDKLWDDKAAEMRRTSETLH